MASRLLVLGVGDAVMINGNADEAQIRSIAESIRPLDNTEWAALLGALQTRRSRVGCHTMTVSKTVVA